MKKQEGRRESNWDRHLPGENSRRPRRVLFYANGDRFFKGKKLSIMPHRYFNMADLLTDITQRLPGNLHLPNGVRQICTPTGGRKVHAVGQFEDGHVYVCCGNEAFKSISYGKYELEPWSKGQSQLHDSMGRTDFSPSQYAGYNAFPASRFLGRGRGGYPAMAASGTVRYAQLRAGRGGPRGLLPPMSQDPRMGVDSQTVGRAKPKVITIVRNGPRPRNVIKVLLNRRSIQSFNQLLNDVGDAFGPAWRTKKLHRLFALNGREVKGVGDFFHEDDIFIGVGSEEISSGDVSDMLLELYPDDPNLHGLVRDWERRERRSNAARLVKAKGRMSQDGSELAAGDGDLLTATVGPEGEEKRDSGFDESDPGESKKPRTSQTNAGQSGPRQQPLQQNNNNNNSPQRASAVTTSTTKPGVQPDEEGRSSSRGYQLPPVRPPAHMERLSMARQERDRVRRRIQRQLENNRRSIDDERKRQGLPQTQDSIARHMKEERAKEESEYEKLKVDFITDPQAARRHEEEQKITGDTTAVRRSHLVLPEPIDEQDEDALITPFTGKTAPTTGAHPQRGSGDEELVIGNLHGGSEGKENNQRILDGRLKKIGQGEIKTFTQQNNNKGAELEQIAIDSRKHVVDISNDTRTDHPAPDFNSHHPHPHTHDYRNTNIHQQQHQQPQNSMDQENSMDQDVTTNARNSQQSVRIESPPIPLKTHRLPLVQPTKRPQLTNNRQQRLQKDHSHDNGKLARQISGPRRVHERYELGKKLGDGNFAVVRHARRIKDGREYAMKVIDKAKLKGRDGMVESEIAIMRLCRHPNIVRLKEEFETKTEIYLVMELVKGGDLFDAITQSVKFTEPQAAHMVKDLANALFYLHSRNIVHRDLKPENLLVLRNKDNTISLKLGDFGLAMEVTRPIRTVCGTPTYVAPEILTEEGYGLEVDMWALGVINYILLCGFPPFRSPERKQTELFAMITCGQFVFLSPYWDHISKSAKDLISNLLVVNKTHRYLSVDVLSHPWIITLGGSAPITGVMASRRMSIKTQLESEAEQHMEQYRNLKAEQNMGKQAVNPLA